MAVKELGHRGEHVETNSCWSHRSIRFRTGTGWATNAHLPYLQQSPYYKITALCNSSVENAKSAIEKYGLGPATKTYGSPADLAADPDVDLVVVSTRVDRHGEVALPSLRAGKAVYCEWPLEANLKKATEMAEAGGPGPGEDHGRGARDEESVRDENETAG